MSKDKKPSKIKKFYDEMNPTTREVLDWIMVTVVAVVLAIFIDTVIIVNAFIPSASMEPTVMTGDRAFGNRLSYINNEIERGDIVIFKYPDNEKELFIKRVIGLPGETLEMIGGKIYIDGTLIDEPYVAEDPIGNYGPVTVPDGAYFMMGDNRNRSADSRYWKQPFVYKNKILGKAILVYWPHPHLIK